MRVPGRQFPPVGDDRVLNGCYQVQLLERLRVVRLHDARDEGKEGPAEEGGRLARKLAGEVIHREQNRPAAFYAVEGLFLFRIVSYIYRRIA